MDGQSKTGGLTTGAPRRWQLNVDDRGRILLPEELRRALGIAPGDVVTATLEGRAARLLSLDEAIQRAQALVRARVQPGRSLVDELLAERAVEGKADAADLPPLTRPLDR